MLTHWPPSGVIWRYGTWSTGLLPDSTEPLPEPMSTYHLWGLVAFRWRHLHRKYSIYQSLSWVWTLRVTSYWARWRLKKPASPLFTHMLACAQIKENIKGLRHSPLWGEFTGDISLWWRHNDITYDIFPRGQWVNLRRKLDPQWFKWCIVLYSVPSHFLHNTYLLSIGPHEKTPEQFAWNAKNSFEEIVFKMSTAKSCRFSQTSLN